METYYICRTNTNMRNIIDCKVLVSEEHGYLNSEITTHLREGYQPLGPATVAATGDKHTKSYRYTITMVKYEAFAEM